MEWNRGFIIGHGSSATVYLATSSYSSDVSAVKSAELSSLSRLEQLQREQRILSSLSSPYIVTYKGCDITKENNKLFYNLFMEYMPSGTLSQAARRRLKEPVIAHYTRQVLQGLEYLHSNGVVHCDIKGSNILIGEDGAKIGDFGCAKRVADTAAAPISGTPMFMAPEVARGEEQGYPCDVWSLGCTVVEMATGFGPWPNVEDPVSVMYRVAYSDELPEIPGFLSEEAKDFLGKCFRRNPMERLTASQLLKHPFLGEFNFNVKQIQGSNSGSPTSILEHGFWNSVEEPEWFNGNLVKMSSENSPAGRIRSLAVCSGDPNWTWDDENWITTRDNEISSTCNNGLDLDELEKSNIRSKISCCFCEDYKCKDVSVVVNSLNFERGITEMLLTSTLDCL
ncbi:mitogen-activated protein kinase kinase kinase 18-like [Gastrolobium bilobum]|uniref:mitogen-activated protein kinase kinase kinase 18-like n=1 Tax=Gastrolobium bilobum TaxID=150636 RepID=UPI002AB19D58|nr:mitogen-activated protein kinase kinase kinase 18-like [Gastrolobium bilobum]